jgi:hypothetical protein
MVKNLLARADAACPAALLPARWNPVNGSSLRTFAGDATPDRRAARRTICQRRGARAP